MPQLPICIHCEAQDLKEGLFGQVFLFAFEILPFLHSRSIYPAWEIRSTLYGVPPHHLTIPGVVDLAYAPPSGALHRVPLNQLRARHCAALGNDWTELSRIWYAYFNVPQRVVDQADQVPALDKALGLHYRGTDKQESTWDSNPISQDHYLTLALDFLSSHSDIKAVFAATDEFSFIEKLRTRIDLPIINLGEVGFHKTSETQSSLAKADRALLDCLLLSRCSAALETSSALPSFAKILNPKLELYRTAASKMFTDIPYFPAAYVPQIQPTTAAGKAILEATMEADWTTVASAARFKKRFTSVPRYRLKDRIWSLREMFTGI